MASKDEIAQAVAELDVAKGLLLEALTEKAEATACMRVVGCITQMTNTAQRLVDAVAETSE